MKPLIPYLLFNGNCREAMHFYKQCFGGELQVMTYADGPKENPCAPCATDKIMHACLSKGDFNIMASDNPMGSPVQGDNFTINIPCDSVAEIETLFAALSTGGTVKAALADTFWGAHFGMLTDKFGIHWMLNGPLKNPQ